MNHTKYFLLAIILMVSSCKKITKQDIHGHWFFMPGSNKNPEFEELYFEDDKFEIITDNLFKESGKYEVKDENIKFSFNRDDLKIDTKIIKLEADTIFISDSLMYQRSHIFTHIPFEEYELIGIKTNHFLSEESNFYYTIHFYKSEGKIRIRGADKIINFDDIPLFLERSNSSDNILIFLGKGIKLKDLKLIYYQLASIGKLKVWLGTRKEGLSDTNIFKDKVEIWRADLESYSSQSNQPPLPPPQNKYRSKQSYLQSGGREIIIFNKMDFNKILDIKLDEKIVISISQDLPLSDYINLKIMVEAAKKTNKNIKTEIST